MKHYRLYSIFIVLVLSFQLADAIEYVDIETYKYRECQQPSHTNKVKKFFTEGWEAFKASVNESVFADNISTEKFWNTLRNSLEDGSFFYRVSSYKTSRNRSGGDIFLRIIYASIKQVPVKYKTLSPQGDSIWVSGKLFLPMNKNAKHIILANHFTVCANSEIPSHASSIEGIFATKDYIVLMPDYIGYGLSDSLTHPYLHLESTVNSAIDLLEAALPYLRDNSYTFYKSIILVGYSQGGAATLALQKRLEEQYDSIFPIEKVFAGAGPYDLTGTYDYYISTQTTQIPCSLPMLLMGMNYGESLHLNVEDFFQPILLESYSDLIESKFHTMTEVNTELGNDISILLKPIINYTDSVPTSILYEAIGRNNIVQWTPKSSLYLFHSLEDDMVPFLNSEHVQAEFSAQNLENIQYDFAPYGSHMKAAVTFFEKVYRLI